MRTINYSKRAVGLFLALAVPQTALAAVPDAKVMCASAAADPAAFLRQTDLDGALGAMLAECPEILEALLNRPTGSIPGATSGGGSGGTAGGGAQAPDYSALLAKLTAATARLSTATNAVALAQEDVSNALGNLRDSGISPAAFRMAMTFEVTTIDTAVKKRKYLSEFTEEQRDAWDRLENARVSLAGKRTALENAQKAVVSALEAARGAAETALSDYLTGKDVSLEGLKAFTEKLNAALKEAQTAVSTALGGETTAREALQKRFPTLQLPGDVAIDVSLGTFGTALQSQITTTTADLKTVSDSLAGLLSDQNTKNGLQQSAYDRWQANVKLLSDALSSAQLTAATAKSTYDSAVAAKTTTGDRLLKAITDVIAMCETGADCKSSTNALNSLRGKLNDASQENFDHNRYRDLPSPLKNLLKNAQTNYNNAQKVDTNALLTTLNAANTAVGQAQTNLTNAQSDTDPLKDAYNKALGDYNLAKKAYDDAVAAEAKLKLALQGLEQESEAFKTLSNELLKAAQLIGQRLLEEKAAQTALDDLTKLVDTLASADKDFNDLEQRAKIVTEKTGKESAAVTDALKELRDALAHAKSVVGTDNEGEPEALKAVEEAKAKLDAALKEQEEALEEGEEVLKEVPTPAPTTEVDEAAGKLEEAIGGTDGNSDAADLSEAAGFAIEDHTDSQTDLQAKIDEVEKELPKEEPKTTTDTSSQPTGSAPDAQSGQTSNGDTQTSGASSDTGTSAGSGQSGDGATGDGTTGDPAGT
jgi:hypothetical protein